MATARVWGGRKEGTVSQQGTQLRTEQSQAGDLLEVYAEAGVELSQQVEVGHLGVAGDEDQAQLQVSLAVCDDPSQQLAHQARPDNKNIRNKIDICNASGNLRPANKHVMKPINGKIDLALLCINVSK